MARLVAVLPAEGVVEKIGVVEAVDLGLLTNVHIGKQQVEAFAVHFLRLQLEGMVALTGSEDADLIERPVMRVRLDQGAEGDLPLASQLAWKELRSQIVEEGVVH